MKEILDKYLEESTQSKRRFRIRTQCSAIDAINYNRLSLNSFRAIYKYMCEDGFVMYADELKEKYKELLKERYKDLLEFLEEE